MEATRRKIAEDFAKRGLKHPYQKEFGITVGPGKQIYYKERVSEAESEDKPAEKKEQETTPKASKRKRKGG